MLNKALEQTLHDAFMLAREFGHELMTLEHLLIALLSNPEAAEALKGCGVNLQELKADLTHYIMRSTPQLSSSDAETQPTMAFQRVLQKAVFHVQSSGNKEVSGADVLVSLFTESESHALAVLKNHQVSRFDIVSYLSHGVDDSRGERQETIDIDADSIEQKQDFISRFCVHLNKKALEGRIDPLIGRDEEINRTVQVLVRRRKNNPLFVGEAGVGKTAIAEGLAYRIVHGDVPEVMKDMNIYSLDMGTLLAGTKYRGDFEKRFKHLLKEICKKKDAILYIDEIHTIVGAGAASGGVMDAANLLKPLLSSGELKCMGSTTYQEYKNIIEKDRALVRRFQKIDVVEPSEEDTVQILLGLKERYEEHHQVRYTQTAIRAAVELSGKYMNDRRFPDKAIDVLDEAGALQRLAPEHKRKKTVGVHDIEAVVAQMARIPEKTVSKDDQKLLADLDKRLKMVVFGQDEAIEELTASIRLARAGLANERQPVGSFLFAGPTGVGKTEVSRQLALTLGVDLLRYDMSEYMEGHSVSRLIGAPPGYVGYEAGGLLTEAVIKTPHCVVLLDEIEKAHPDILNVLLQVMDNGTLTDNNGRQADFRNVILIMTTNAGAREANKRGIGFVQQVQSIDALAEVKRIFAPEFRNRLDAIVWFNHLSQDIVYQVVDKFICQLQAQLDKKRVSLEIEPEVRDWLLEEGYDKDMGARPMHRVIQQHIKKPLASEILFGRLAKGGAVRVILSQDQEEGEQRLDFLYEEEVIHS